MGSGFSRKKKDAKLMQQQITQMHQQMSQTEMKGSAGNGLVTITLSGDGEMKTVKIKPECVDPEDVEGLELLIKSAYNDAQKNLKEKAPAGMSNLFG